MAASSSNAQQGPQPCFPSDDPWAQWNVRGASAGTTGATRNRRETFEDLQEVNPYEPPEANGPNEVVPDPESNYEEYLKYFRECVAQHLSIRNRKLFLDQKDLWEDQEELAQPPKPHGNRPEWVEIEQQEELWNWGGVLKEDLECDQESIEAFQILVKNRGPLGLMEGSRIIHHLLKDKQKEGRGGWEWEEESDRNSRWLLTASEEALEALDKRTMWESGGPLAQRHMEMRRREQQDKGKHSKDKGAWRRQGLR